MVYTIARTDKPLQDHFAMMPVPSQCQPVSVEFQSKQLTEDPASVILLYGLLTFQPSRDKFEGKL